MMATKKILDKFRRLDMRRSRQQSIERLLYLASDDKFVNRMHGEEYDVFVKCLNDHDHLDVENQARVFKMFRRITGKRWI